LTFFRLLAYFRGSIYDFNQHSTWHTFMGKSYGLRTCKNPSCDISFTPYRSWQEFHSPSCRNSYYEKYLRHPLAQAITEIEKVFGEGKVKREKSR